MIEPTPAVAANGVVYSNCFFRRTNHQSTANIAKAITFIVAQRPTYLTDDRTENSNLFVGFVEKTR